MKNKLNNSHETPRKLIRREKLARVIEKIGEGIAQSFGYINPSDSPVKK